MVNFGLIGLGYFGKNYARLLQEIEGAALLAVVGGPRGDVGLAQNIRRCETAAGLLKDGTIDAVVIATPPSTHLEIAQAALAAGKHVLLEKPMVLNVKDADALAASVKKSGRTFMVGHQYLYNDYVRALKEELLRGVIGDVRYAYAEHFSPGPLRNDAGVIWEMTTHEVAVFDYLLGPLEISDARGMKAGIALDDFSSYSFSAAGGCRVSVAASFFAPEKVRRMFFAGTKGQALFDDRESAGKLKFYSREYPEHFEGSSYFFPPGAERPRIPDVQAREPLRNQVEHFIDCIRSKKEPLTGIEHGMRVTRVLDIIEKAISKS